MKAWAIKHPNGKLLIDTISITPNAAWSMGWWEPILKEEMIAKGYRLIEIEITEVE